MGFFCGTLPYPFRGGLLVSNNISCCLSFERLVSADLVPLIATAFITSGSSHPILDGVLGVSLVMHSHFEVCSLHLKCPVSTTLLP